MVIKMFAKDVKSLLRKVLDTGLTIFRLRPDFFVKGLIYCIDLVSDLLKD